MTKQELFKLEMDATKQTRGRTWMTGTSTNGDITCTVKPHGRGSSGKGYVVTFSKNGERISKASLMKG